jgi:hypothetical protein
MDMLSSACIIRAGIENRTHYTTLDKPLIVGMFMSEDNYFRDLKSCLGSKEA